MPIHTNEQGWILETQSTGYAIGLNRAGLLTHRYWGARLPRLQDYPATLDSPGYSFNSPAHLTLEEYPGYEDIKFVDPCIKTTFADGVRDVVLRFESAEVDQQAVELRLKLRDTVYPLSVTLHYRVHAAYDLIERWVTAANPGTEPIRSNGSGRPNGTCPSARATASAMCSGAIWTRCTCAASRCSRERKYSKAVD